MSVALRLEKLTFCAWCVERRYYWSGDWVTLFQWVSQGSRHLSFFDAPVFKYTLKVFVVGQVRRIAGKRLFLWTSVAHVDITLWYISRVCYVVFAVCKVAWKWRVLVCLREKTSTVFHGPSIILAVCSAIALEADLILDDQSALPVNAWDAAGSSLTIQAQRDQDALGDTALVHLSPTGRTWVRQECCKGGRGWPFLSSWNCCWCPFLGFKWSVLCLISVAFTLLFWSDAVYRGSGLERLVRSLSDRQHGEGAF